MAIKDTDSCVICFATVVIGGPDINPFKKDLSDLRKPLCSKCWGRYVDETERDREGRNWLFSTYYPAVG